MNKSINTPKLTIYHPNARNTGAAIQFELKPAHASEYGCEEGAIYCRMANQKTAGDRTTKPPTFATFDWENAIIAKLGFDDVCKILQVLRGECESINEDKGIFFRTSKYQQILLFRAQYTSFPGYEMTLIRTNIANNENDSVRIIFSTSEALGLNEVLGASLKDIAFGTGYEATSIAFARDEAIAKQAASIAAEAAKKERETAEAENRYNIDKAVAKVNAVGRLCAVYGKEHEHTIQEAVDRACGDTKNEHPHLSANEFKLGMDALGKDHIIWKYVVATYDVN